MHELGIGNDISLLRGVYFSRELGYLNCTEWTVKYTLPGPYFHAEGGYSVCVKLISFVRDDFLFKEAAQHLI